MKLETLGDRVVIKQLVAEETTKSGIVLPGQAKEKPQYAEVIEVGPGAVVDGKLVPMDVKVGDTVTLVGKDGDEFLSCEEVAETAGSFNYEFVCDVSKRIPRVYYFNGKIVDEVHYVGI